MVYMQLVFIRKKLGQNIEIKAKERYGKTDALEQKNKKQKHSKATWKLQTFLWETKNQPNNWQERQ